MWLIPVAVPQAIAAGSGLFIKDLLSGTRGDLSLVVLVDVSR